MRSGSTVNDHGDEETAELFSGLEANGLVQASLKFLVILDEAHCSTSGLVESVTQNEVMGSELSKEPGGLLQQEQSQVENISPIR